MAVLFHVIIAMLSLAYSVYLFVSPSQARLRVSYGLITLTIASGTYLIAAKPSHMLETCMMGLFYLSLSIMSVALARRKLADERIVR